MPMSGAAIFLAAIHDVDARHGLVDATRAMHGAALEISARMPAHGEGRSDGRRRGHNLALRTLAACEEESLAVGGGTVQYKYYNSM